MTNELIRQQITTGSAEATERLGAEVGERLKGGEVIELVSDLGGGKTTFVRGLARGMGYSARVTSPTFTVMHEYQAGKLTLYHFDLYRLEEAGVMADELAEVAGSPEAVVVAEWADVARHALPAASMVITIEAIGENERRLTFKYPRELGYLLESRS